MEFRSTRGRAIAAPQIGMKKTNALHAHRQASRFHKSSIHLKSPELIELWDDCMSFPDLLVKVDGIKHVEAFGMLIARA